LRSRATGPLADAHLRGRVRELSLGTSSPAQACEGSTRATVGATRACGPPGAERPASARFRESVAGFEETHRSASSGVSGQAVLRGNAGSSRTVVRGSTDVASLSWLGGESLPSDEVRGRMGLIPLSHEASHSHRKVRMAPVESRRFGQTMARALNGACQPPLSLGRVGWAGLACPCSPAIRRRGPGGLGGLRDPQACDRERQR
jgi:hypothetical protein